MSIPFEGTIIGSDGKRYSDTDPSAPTIPVSLMGGGAVADLSGRVEAVESVLDTSDATQGDVLTVDDPGEAAIWDN